jgi:hypothetical protein
VISSPARLGWFPGPSARVPGGSCGRRARGLAASGAGRAFPGALVERPGAPLDAVGPVADGAVQGELAQVRQAGVLVVDEQAGGAVVGGRDWNLISIDGLGIQAALEPASFTDARLRRAASAIARSGSGRCRPGGQPGAGCSVRAQLRGHGHHVPRNLPAGRGEPKVKFNFPDISNGPWLPRRPLRLTPAGGEASPLMTSTPAMSACSPRLTSCPRPARPWRPPGPACWRSCPEPAPARPLSRQRSWRSRRLPRRPRRPPGQRCTALGSLEQTHELALLSG